MSGHINLKVTHRLLWRLYGYRAIVALLSGFGILFFPGLFVGSMSYTVIETTLPYTVIGVLWLIAGILIAGALFKWPYKLARIGIGISIVLYGLWGTGLLTNSLLNEGTSTALFAVLAYYSLSLTSFFMLLEPPINPETALKNTKIEE